jgi:predicted dehydrogenase
MMAERRARAFLETGRAAVCGIVSRRIERARRLGGIVDCGNCFDDLTLLSGTRPDAVLIEIPHRTQDVVTLWALETGIHALVGGCLASSLAAGRRIRELAAEQRLVVEAGYEARYKAVWESTRHIVLEGGIGTPVAVRSVALFSANPASWYYSERESGGMPITHMTYAFINPARWIFGDPEAVSAFGNRMVEREDDRVGEETCSANLLFPKDVICNMIAGYVSAGGAWWSFTIFGTSGVLDVHPSEMDAGELFLHRRNGVEHRRFDDAPDPFVRQANAFLDAIDGCGTCLNGPGDTVGDLIAADAIVRSARERRTIALPG